jgi:hypothetical protein
MKGKLESGDVFWVKCVVSHVGEDDHLSYESTNGSCVSGLIINGADTYFDNEVMVDKEILDRNQDELILIDGKEIPKKLIKDALKDYIK